VADVDDQLLQLADAIDELVAVGELELVSTHGAASLAGQLLAALEVDPDLELGDWLVERVEVNEVFLDDAALRDRLRPALARIAAGDPACRTNPALLAPIADRPDDLQARLVYADWLSQAGDPRGELIMLQARGDEPRREQQLLAHYHTFFLGNLRRWNVETTWRLGFFDRVVAFSAVAVAELLELESSRLLRELHVAVHGEQEIDELDKLLGRVALPPTLTSLQLGQLTRYAGGTLHLGPATRGLARLARLSVSAGTIVLDGLDLPSLRYLSIREISRDQRALLPKTLDGLDLTGNGFDDERDADARRSAPNVRLVTADPIVPGALTDERIRRARRTGGEDEDSDEASDESGNSDSGSPDEEDRYDEIDE
jgi:uncharacterized protein (TIGR02996 family)